MNKTIKINISGIVFQIEEDAFEILRDYLKAITSRFKNLPGGSETIGDIESRIAEIFQSQQTVAGMITKENVLAVIEIIGKPEDFEEEEEKESIPDYSPHRRRLYRNRDDSIISGVCGGIGAYLNFDPVWIRLFLIILAVVYGIGFFVYLALWIALPYAVTDEQKKELHGSFYHLASSRKKTTAQGSQNDGLSRIGHVFNEVFSAIGKAVVIFLRVILIIIGVTFVVTGFLTLITVFLVFFMKYPGLIHTDTFNSGVFYLPDVINYLLTPSHTPLIIVLISVAVALPLLAIIYWGVKMIFQFRAKDGLLSLIFFLVWLGSILLLSILFFNQGIGFAEEGKRLENIIIRNPADTLFIKVDKRLTSAQYDNEIAIPGYDSGIMINQTTKELFIRPTISIETSEDSIAKVEVVKTSRGSTRDEALQKAGGLIYNQRVSNDTIYVDEYYTVPSQNKWAGADIEVSILLPEGSVVYFDRESEVWFNYSLSGNDYSDYSDNEYWLMTRDGLEMTTK